MIDIFLFAVLLLGLGGLAAYWRNARARALARDRMERSAETTEAAEAVPVPAAQSYLVRHRFVPWVFGLVTALVLHFAFGWALPFVIAVSLIVSLQARATGGLSGGRADGEDRNPVGRRHRPDGGRTAGGGQRGRRPGERHGESRAPLRPQLEEVVGRIRFGDSPRAAYQGLTERVPLETFLFFASALSVQSETGGSLAPTLASVGRTIRDRIEMARRIRSNSAQSEVSTMAVLFLTYFIALIVWRTNPEQMHEFLATSIGQWAVRGPSSCKPWDWCGCR